MRDERPLQLVGRERRDAFLERGSRASVYARADVDELRGAVDHDGCGRSRSFRIRARRARSEQDHLGPRLTDCRSHDRNRQDAGDGSHGGGSSFKSRSKGSGREGQIGSGGGRASA